MTWKQAMFGFFGLPLMIVFASGIIFNIYVGLGLFSVWAVCFYKGALKLNITGGKNE